MVRSQGPMWGSIASKNPSNAVAKMVVKTEIQYFSWNSKFYSLQIAYCGVSQPP